MVTADLRVLLLTQPRGVHRLGGRPLGHGKNQKLVILTQKGYSLFFKFLSNMRSLFLNIRGMLLWVVFALVGCSSVELIGTSNYAPLPENSEVLVFTSEDQIKQPFEVVGIISYDNPGELQILTLGHAIEPLKEKARQVGGNAIISGNSRTVKSGTK